MAVNAKPQVWRAQLSRGVQRAAPDDRSRAEAAGLTAKGRQARAMSEAKAARRAPVRRKRAAMRSPKSNAWGVSKRTD